MRNLSHTQTINADHYPGNAALPGTRETWALTCNGVSATVGTAIFARTAVVPAAKGEAAVFPSSVIAGTVAALIALAVP